MTRTRHDETRETRDADRLAMLAVSSRHTWYLLRQAIIRALCWGWGLWDDPGHRRRQPLLGVTLTLNLLLMVALPGVSSVAAKNNSLWTLTSRMLVARQGQTATLLPSGRVLVAGGCCDKAGRALAGAELYDPRTGRWTATGAMSAARQGQTATLLPNGRVLVAGGCCDKAGRALAGA